MHPQIEKILKLPAKTKILSLMAFVIIEISALVWFMYVPKYKEHSSLKNELVKLNTEIQDKTKMVANLPALQMEYDQLNFQLTQALTELPNTKEIPALLTSITSLGKGAGLDFMVFKPKSEVLKDFYAEVPVEVVVSGSFFSVAKFFVDVSNLPRIVNISDVNFAEIKIVNNKIMAKVNCLATTFRFLDKKEIKDDKKPAKK